MTSENNKMIMITSGDYASFPEEMSFIDRQKNVKDATKQQFKKYCRSNEKQCDISDSQIYIFWKNVPRTYIDICNNNYLLYCICQEIGNIENNDFTVYVDKMSTLSEGKMDVLLRRLCILYSVTNLRPTILNIDISQKDRKNATSVLEKFFMGELNNSYSDTLTLMNSFSIMAGSEDAFNMSEFEEPNFIKEYIKWQLGKITVDVACKNLGSMSRRTFYKYVAEIEVSPLYPQFIGMYENELKDKAKKGYYPEDWDAYLKDVEATAAEVICRKYNLLMTTDVVRTRLALEKKMNAKLKRESKTQ